MPSTAPEVIHLRRGGVSVVLRTGPGVPAVLHWGEPLPVGPDVPALWPAATRRVALPHQPDPDEVPLVQLPSDGWGGEATVRVRREGRPVPLAVRTTAVRADGDSADLVCTDDAAHVEVAIRLGLSAHGLLELVAEVRNIGESPLEVSTVALALPIPADESQVLDLASRSRREKHVQRHELTLGRHEQRNEVSRANRASIWQGSCRPGSGWRTGSTHTIHVAWSGATVTRAERSANGLSWLAAGELLEPGEILLGPGEAYRTPTVVAAWGEGLDAVAARHHAWVRELASYPSGPRPVTMNSWEATYFDHSLPRLVSLAERAAAVGVERFVLDDGWFGARRDDTTGLGDWEASPEVWPEGLLPLASHVHGLGMQFGLWVEPEMVNATSRLAVEHPDWVCGPGDRVPLPSRHQQVLNLAIPEARAHVRGQLAALIGSLHVDYLKWDFNRDVLEPWDRTTGLPVRHALVDACWELMDSLRREFPWLEIESCAGGGGRTDLGMARHVQRFWPSDSIDPLERLSIMAGTCVLLPPEVCGSHIASAASHSTGRSHTLSVRAVVALFGHLGIEWDLTTCSPAELDALAWWVDLHKRFRGLIASGELVHADLVDPGWRAFGVVSPQADEALFAVVAVELTSATVPGRVRLPGLRPDARYRVEGIAGPDPEQSRRGLVPPAWWTTPTTVLPGWLLDQGLALPGLFPEQAVLLQLKEVDR